MKTILALVDCNNFFVSCERLFRADLEGKPVVVLSSNDGCVISRSNEAKALGIPMAAPAFEYRPIFAKHGVTQFSANFELYGDISQRIISLITTVCPRTEAYSVDEAFLDLSHLPIKDYEAWSRSLGGRILRDVGVPVSIGIASSKTLAKLASQYAKQHAGLGDVLDLASLDDSQRAVYLTNTPLADIWGIGRRLAPKLKAEGIFNALQLAKLRPKRARQLMGINGQRLVAELNGQACHGLAGQAKPRQSVMNGRTFGEDTNQLSVIEAAVASMVARAARSLRREGLLAARATVFLNTNRHKPGYAKQPASIRLPTPSADTGYLIRELMRAIETVFNPNIYYHRVNVMFDNLISQTALQADIFGQLDTDAHDLATSRLAALDNLNSRHGKHTLYYAAEDLAHSWQPKRQLISPRYTTSWNDLPLVKPV